VRVFLGLLARAVHKGLVEVHAYSVLSTHFHLLVGSAEGTIAQGVGWVEDLYARYFNRTRERDGHVFKGRYFARRVDDLAYLAMVVTYIDQNAVSAGMVAHPAQYPHGSAQHYVGSRNCPWLTREVVERLACQVARTPDYGPHAYAELWRTCQPIGGDALVAEAVKHPRAPVAPILRLLCAGPQYVQQWLLERATAEEGAKGVALALSAAQVLEMGRRMAPGLHVSGPSGSVRAMHQPLTASLLRILAGMTTQQIARRMDVSQPLIVRWIRWHREALAGDPAYLETAGRLVAQAIRGVYGTLATIPLAGNVPSPSTPAGVSLRRRM
jgi:hypothetical protein